MNVEQLILSLHGFVVSKTNKLLSSLCEIGREISDAFLFLLSVSSVSEGFIDACLCFYRKKYTRYNAFIYVMFSKLALDLENPYKSVSFKIHQITSSSLLTQ